MHIDLEKVRTDTPGCRHRAHLNNAGASLMPRQVTEAVVDHLRLEERIGGYEAADEAAERIEGVRRSAAHLVGAEPAEVALMENATRAWAAAFESVPLKAGQRILTGRAEYCSNYMAYLERADRDGLEIIVVEDDEHGQVDLEALEREVDERAGLISFTHVPTSGGLVNPAKGIGRIARRAAVPFLLDACQSVGQMPIDVGEVGCDMLSTTGRKFLRGPRGTGFLYLRRELAESAVPRMPEVGGGAWTATGSFTLADGARRFETWEASHASRLGLGRAIDYALELGLEPIAQRVRSLAGGLRGLLSRLPAVQVRDAGEELCAIVTFSHRSVPARELKERLAAHRVNVDVSTPEDTRLDFERRSLPELVRASVHYFNTEEELNRLVDIVADA